MTPGPNQILKTPLTKSLVKIATIGSGNTFGARFWTDGKREAPMLPDQPWLRLLPGNNGGELFWTDECEQVAEEEPRKGGGAYQNVPFAEAPAPDDYRRALAEGTAASANKEIYIRTRLWWLANDPIRRGESSAPAAPDFCENLSQLRSLLDESNLDQRLMSAEICRELGDFAAADALLAFEFPDGYERAVDLIKNLSVQRDALVRALT